MLISEKKVKIESPMRVAETVRSLMAHEDEIDRQHERFYVFGMNNKNVVQYVEMVSLGTISETIVHPREVFRRAISYGCASIVIAHNHPSGVLKPSAEDIGTTRRLKEAGVIIGIILLDHVIVTETEYLSMKEDRILFEEES